MLVRDRLRGVVLLGRDRRVIAEALSRHAPDVRVIEVDDGETSVMDRVVGAAAEQRVTVTTAEGERVSYLFTLTRQPAGQFAGCWMIDGVLRMPSFEEEQVVMHIA